MRVAVLVLLIGLLSSGFAGSNPLNPDLSVIGVFGGAWTDDAVSPRFDGGLDELELVVKADVDPFLTAEGFIAATESGVSLEEAWVSTLALPAGLKATLGKIRGTFGKLNLSHEHAWYAVSPPLASSFLFDEAVLVDHGARLAWLSPLPVFVELTAEALRGNDRVSFSGGSVPDWAGVGHLKTFFELGEAWSLELGGSGAGGPNAPGLRTLIYGADLALRFRDPRTKTHRNVSLFAEAVLSDRGQLDASGSPEIARARGGWVLLDIQPFRAWHVAGRVDYMEEPASPDVDHHAYGGSLSYSPSEFSNLMFEVRSDSAGGTSWTTVSGRLTFALGPHGAHPF